MAETLITLCDIGANLKAMHLSSEAYQIFRYFVNPDPEIGDAMLDVGSVERTSNGRWVLAAGIFASYTIPELTALAAWMSTLPL